MGDLKNLQNSNSVNGKGTHVTTWSMDTINFSLDISFIRLSIDFKVYITYI